MSFLGGLLGGAASLVGGLFGGGDDPGARQAAANAANLREALNYLQESRGRQNVQLTRAEGAVGRRTDEIRALLDRTMADVDSLGRSSRRSILDRETASMADVRSGLNASGLGNTSVVANAQRGVRADTDRSLLGLNDQLARTRAGIRQGNAGILGSLLGDEVGVLTNRAAFEAQNAGQVASLYGGSIQPVTQTGYRPSGLGNALGNLGGFILGGGLDFGNLFGNGGKEG